MNRPLAVIAALTLLIASGRAEPSPTTAPFLQATQPRAWSFPHDHGRHDGFKTEWWYFTGNLADPSGRAFGYQLTFFRTSLVRDAVDRPSAWAMRDLYFGHAAISDLADQRFLFRDALSRQRADLAGASDQGLDVQLLGWSAQMAPAGQIHLLARERDFSIDLTCSPGRGPTLQGPGGVNLKGANREQASYYYSMTRLPTNGVLTLGDKTYRVSGQSWMDHEFSSNALGAGQVGWDWMGLSLKNGDDLMIYRMRRGDGGSDYLSGTIIAPNGSPAYLTAGDITLTPSHPWTSPQSGASYPQQWMLRVKGVGEFVVISRMSGQELRTGGSTRVDYFEGAAEVTDPAGRPLGEGYLEMTGYGKQLGGF